MAILRMSSIFAESANRLPKEARAKLPKAFMLLTSNPRHPSLQLKKIKGAIRSNVYECRLDRSWRLILQGIGEMTFDLVYVGAHDEAIGYGAQLRERGSPYGSSVSIMERLESYLAGDDQALEFVAVTSEDLRDSANNQPAHMRLPFPNLLRQPIVILSCMVLTRQVHGPRGDISTKRKEPMQS